MKLLIEHWRTFADGNSDDDKIIDEAMELCRTYKNGLLIPKNKNQRKFLEQLQEMLVLLEQGQITRRQFAKGMGAGAVMGLAGTGVARAAMSKKGKEKPKAAPDAGGDIGSVAKGAVGLAIQGIVGAFDLITMGVENFVTQCYIDFSSQKVLVSQIHPS